MADGDRSFPYTRRAASFALTAGMMLSGCAAVDHFGPRAVAYNNEANDTRSSLALANIVRAAYREPLQFSEVSSVTGIASAGGTLGASIPVIGTGSSLSPQITASGGPNFSFSNLSTQEFYQASSAEIDNTTIALMLNQGFSPQVVFPLVISDITISDKKTIRRVRMDVDNARQFRSSFTAITGLLLQGLTAKSISSNSQIGPDLSPTEAKEAALNILRAQDVSKEPSLDKDKYSDHVYRLSKGGNKVTLCFDRTLFEQTRPGDDNDTNKYVLPQKVQREVHLALKDGEADPDFTIKLPDDYRCGTEKAVSKRDWKPRPDVDDVKLVFRMRSLQGIYEYLGSLARIELGLDGPATSLGLAGPGVPPTFVFKIQRGEGGPADIVTSTDFGDFSISPDPTGYDLSTQSLKAIAFLQALNSKATSLPAPVTTSVLVR